MTHRRATDAAASPPPAPRVKSPPAPSVSPRIRPVNLEASVTPELTQSDPEYYAPAVWDDAEILGETKNRQSWRVRVKHHPSTTIPKSCVLPASEVKKVGETGALWLFLGQAVKRRHTVLREISYWRPPEEKTVRNNE